MRCKLGNLYLCCERFEGKSFCYFVNQIQNSSKRKTFSSSLVSLQRLFRINMNYNVDKLNIVLIILSAMLAYYFPLELFIFAYAILGPLHYVTEIKWLDNKNYFFADKKQIWLSIGVFVSLLVFLPKLYYQYGAMNNSLGKAMLYLDSWSNGGIFIALLLAIGTQFIRSKVAWLVLVIVGVVGAVFLQKNASYNDLIGLFIPTIIHVYVFTLIFMLYGAKKSKSTFGYLAVVFALIRHERNYYGYRKPFTCCYHIWYIYPLCR